MNEYAALLVKMGELEGAILATKQEMRSIPKRMACELRTSRQRVDAAHYLYWFSDIPVQDIAEGLLGMDINGWHIDQFMEHIGTHTIDVACDRCRQPVECRSRQQMGEISKAASSKHGPKYPEGYRVLCASCWDAVQRERMTADQAQ